MYGRASFIFALIHIGQRPATVSSPLAPHRKRGISCATLSLMFNKEHTLTPADDASKFTANKLSFQVSKNAFLHNPFVENVTLWPYACFLTSRHRLQPHPLSCVTWFNLPSVGEERERWCWGVICLSSDRSRRSSVEADFRGSRMDWALCRAPLSFLDTPRFCWCSEMGCCCWNWIGSPLEDSFWLFSSASGLRL